MTPATPAAAGVPWHAKLHVRILVGMGAAFVLAGILRASDLEDLPALEATVAFVGQAFLRLLKMIIVPLVFATVASGVASIEPSSLGRIGLRTLAWYLATSALAVITGLALVNLIRPGAGVALPSCAADSDCRAGYTCVDDGCRPTLEPAPLTEVLLDIIPVNPVASMAATYDLPATLFFAIFLGLAIGHLGERAAVLRSGLDALSDVMSWITDRIMVVAPLGIFALLLEVLLSTGFDVLASLLRYMVTVLAGLTIHAVLTIPLLYLLVARRSPLGIARAMTPALLMAFSTASSSATLPLTWDCVERSGVRRRIASFVLPLGATVNMDGTALYQAVAALFIAQAWGIDLSLGQQVVVFLTATLAAIGAAGVPSAGLVTMIIVLQAVGLPLEGIALVVAVDRVLDMVRTAVNVWGDSAGASVIDALEPPDDVPADEVPAPG